MAGGAGERLISGATRTSVATYLIISRHAGGSSSTGVFYLAGLTNMLELPVWDRLARLASPIIGGLGSGHVSKEINKEVGDKTKAHGLTCCFQE